MDGLGNVLKYATQSDDTNFFETFGRIFEDILLENLEKLNGEEAVRYGNMSHI